MRGHLVSTFLSTETKPASIANGTSRNRGAESAESPRMRNKNGPHALAHKNPCVRVVPTAEERERERELPLGKGEVGAAAYQLAAGTIGARTEGTQWFASAR